MGGEEPRATGLSRNHRRDGDTIWCEWYHSALLDEAGQIVSILSFVQDVSSRIQAEERLQYLATRDALTGLPNRLLLHERLTQAISKAKRSGQRVGVLFIDLDRFKNVNDTLGHRIGDELLKRVTAALERAARDRPAGAAGRRRVHGDRRGLRRSRRCDRIAQKLLDAFAQPFEIEGTTSSSPRRSASPCFPRTDDPEELLKHADIAMYRAKDRPQHLPVPRREWPSTGRSAHARDGAAHRAGERQAAVPLPAVCRSTIARSSAPRRCCAGTIPSMGTCRRRCSSRSPRNRA